MRRPVDQISQHHRQQRIQRSLFSTFDQEVGPQTPKHGRLMVVLDWLEIERYFYEPLHSRGRPRRCRSDFVRAFVAKAVFGLNSTRGLIDRLRVDAVLRRICGFEPTRRLPCEATFSNAFAEIAAEGLVEKIHGALVKSAYGDILSDQIVGHVSRDSTDIPVRVRLEKKPKTKWRRKKGKKKRLSRQLGMSLEEMLKDLPKKADLGRKGGHTWKGYKLHVDCGDGGIPLSAIVTSASLHDSQAAIPLEEMTCSRVTSLYTLMDKAYDASEIRTHVASKNKVPLISPQKRQGEVIPLDLAQRKRLGERTTIERVFSRLKDNFGASHVRVRGHAKVAAHLMFGVVALTAEQIVRTFA